MADLASILEKTLAPNRQVIQQATRELELASASPGHHFRILQLVESNTNLAIRQAAAIHFKNCVKYHWQEDSIFNPETKEWIRQHVVDLMCRVPALLQELLSESIALIAKSDYPGGWKTFLPDLVQRLAYSTDSNDITILNGLLKTANSIFKTFRYVQRSDELYAVIIYTLKGIQEPLTMLFTKISAEIKSQGNTPMDEPRLESLRLMCRIYYSLNYQDLPEYFEEHLRLWMQEFAYYLSFTDHVGSDPDDAPNGIDKLQSAILVILDLYAVQDEESFMEYLPTFTKLVWELLNSKLPRHDTLTVPCIQFLSSLMEKPMHKSLFENPETLKLILVQIIIPNLAFRESDMEKFTDDPADFMLTEVEGSGSDSRRRKAQVCLKSLCKTFNDATVALVQQHVQLLLQEYQQNPDVQWAKKDVAIHLIMGVAIKRDTIQWGVSEINPSVNIVEFFQQQIIPELEDASPNRPVVKAAAIKFIATFRFQFTREQLIEMIKLLIGFYKSPVVVIHTYAAYATERILFTKEAMEGPGLKVARIRNVDLAPIVEAIFNGLFAIAEQIEERENEYAMKAIMRALVVADRDILPVYRFFLERLTNLVERISKNPRNPNFNHCLFDSIACIVLTVCSADANAVGTVESLLSVPFMQLLQQQVTDFTPYVFQILAQVLEFRPMGLGDNFQALFEPLLSAELWSQQGNVPALTRLVKAYITKAPQDLAGKIVPLLGIFQKLISASSTEISAYSLLRCILASFPPESFQPYIGQLFGVILTTIQGTADSKGRKKDNAVAFFSFFVGRFGAVAFMDTLGSLGNDLGMTVVTKVWAPTLSETDPKLPVTAKEHVVGVTRLLTETVALLTTAEYRDAWVKLFVAVASIVASPVYRKLGDSDYTSVTPEMNMTFDNAFSQLSYAKALDTDYFSDISDAGHIFGQTLQGFLNQHREMAPLIQQDRNADAVTDTFHLLGFPLA